MREPCQALQGVRNNEFFKVELFAEMVKSTAAKEVSLYVSALLTGFELVKKTGLITNNHIMMIQEELGQNKAGFRILPATDLKNQNSLRRFRKTSS